MRKFFTRLAIAGAVIALAVVVASPVNATCTADRTLGTYIVGGSSGTCGFYCYVSSPGDNTATSMEGYYWVLTQGTTRNSGSYQFDGTGGSQPWFIPNNPFPNGWSLTTTVNNGGTNGCPSPSPPGTVFLFQDTNGGGGGSSMYALAAVDETIAGQIAFDLGVAIGGGNPGQLVLQPMPNCTITNTSRDGGGNLIVDLSWTPNGAAAFVTSSSTITAVGQVITGWNFYSHEVLRGA